MLQMLRPSTPEFPKALKIQPPTRAPTTPKTRSPNTPAGASPGTTLLARKPATIPTTIHARMLTECLLLSAARALRLVADVALGLIDFRRDAMAELVDPRLQLFAGGHLILKRFALRHFNVCKAAVFGLIRRVFDVVHGLLDFVFQIAQRALPCCLETVA